MNVLVTGANGQLGKTLQDLYQKNSDHLKFTFASKSELDISNKIQLIAKINLSNLNFY